MECEALQHGSRRGRPGRDHGRAVQVDPIKPKLKPPGTKRLKLKSDDSLSSFGFNFNLRRYTMGYIQTPGYADESHSATRSLGSNNATQLAGQFIAMGALNDDTPVGPARHCRQRHRHAF